MSNKKTIKFYDLRPDEYIKKDINKAIRRVLDSGTYIGGAEVQAFEEEFAAYCNSLYCVGVGNGFDALQLILRAYDIGIGDHVIVQSNTCQPTVAAIEHVGATPLFVDTDNPYSPFMSIDGIHKRDNVNIKAVIAVHLYGQISPYMLMIKKWCSELGWLLIEDAAQAHGATIGVQKAGSIGDAAAFSFYPTKNLGAYGDGGAVTTNDINLAKRIRELREYGGMLSSHYVGGANSRLDPLQAAVLRVKLKHLDRYYSIRSGNVSCYKRAFNGLRSDSLSTVTFTLKKVGAKDSCLSVPCWHQFVIRTEYRNALKTFLAECGIETIIHYPVPMHKLMQTGQDLRNSENLCNTVLSLPVAPHITEKDIEYITDAITAFFRRNYVA